jgi:hypothetical protein
VDLASVVSEEEGDVSRIGRPHDELREQEGRDEPMSKIAQLRWKGDEEGEK